MAQGKKHVNQREIVKNLSLLHASRHSKGVGCSVNIHSKEYLMTSGNDMKMAENTYSGFIGLMKWGTIVSVIVAAIVVMLIS